VKEKAKRGKFKMKFLNRVVTIVVVLGSFCQDVLSADPALDSPSAVVKAYYLAIGKGDLDKIRGFYSSDLEAFYKSQTPERRAMMESGKTVTFGDTITGVDVTKEDLQDDKAWVKVTIHYQHHEDAHFSAGVVKENGTWKVGND
jgi:ketosteroid isomerase-like protein